MYSKTETALLKQEFWTAFGHYMSPILSADGEKISWLNYKTGEKHIAFRMEATNKKGSVTIEINHTDAELQQLYFEQFGQLKKIFEQTAGEGWQWKLHTANEYGITVSVIITEVLNVSIYKKEDWPALISFFKTTIVALDEFWSNVKYSFEALR